MDKKLSKIIADLEEKGKFDIADDIRAAEDNSSKEKSLDDTSPEKKIQSFLTNLAVTALTSKIEELNDLLLDVTSRPGAANFIESFKTSISDTMTKMVNSTLKKIK